MGHGQSSSFGASCPDHGSTARTLPQSGALHSRLEVFLATAAAFRRLALALPQATEGTHHPDFRVANKVFAAIGVPDAAWGMVKLTPEQQAILKDAEPTIFKPAAGAWGRRGSTHVRLAAIDQKTLRSALEMAWRNTAPTHLLAKPSGA
jgi:hypothetical protein